MILGAYRLLSQMWRVCQQLGQIPQWFVGGCGETAGSTGRVLSRLLGSTFLAPLVGEHLSGFSNLLTEGWFWDDTPVIFKFEQLLKPLRKPTLYNKKNQELLWCVDNKSSLNTLYVGNQAQYICMCCLMEFSQWLFQERNIVCPKSFHLVFF